MALNWSKGWNAVRLTLRDPERKPLAQIAWEAAHYGWVKRGLPRTYFYKMLHRRHVADPNSYLSGRESMRIRHLVKEGRSAVMLRDKIQFQLHFQSAPGVRLPHYFGHVRDAVYHAPDGTTQPLASPADVEALVPDLLAQLSERESPAVFAKPYDQQSGDGAFKLQPGDALEPFWRAVQGSDYVLQEAVVQHPAISALYPHSLNTLRIMTCLPADGTPRIATVRLRVGMGGRFVDNANQGGVYGCVDTTTGYTAALFTQKSVQGGRSCTHHPDTGARLTGVEIPHFETVREMVLAAARHFPYPLVGWDVGIALDGPVLIEGNHHAAYGGDEVACGGYLANPVLRPFLLELNGGKPL